MSCPEAHGTPELHVCQSQNCLCAVLCCAYIHSVPGERLSHTLLIPSLQFRSNRCQSEQQIAAIPSNDFIPTDLLSHCTACSLNLPSLLQSCKGITRGAFTHPSETTAAMMMMMIVYVSREPWKTIHNECCFILRIYSPGLVSFLLRIWLYATPDGGRLT